jgi:hypothetical protein
MANEDLVQVQDVAAAVVLANGVERKVRNCRVARIETGIYRLTIDGLPPPSTITGDGGGPDLPAVECIAEGGSIETTPLTMFVEHFSNTIKDIRLWNEADALSDGDFQVTLSRLLG